jgi:hypothetical protein
MPRSGTRMHAMIGRDLGMTSRMARWMPDKPWWYRWPAFYLLVTMSWMAAALVPASVSGSWGRWIASALVGGIAMTTMVVVSDDHARRNTHRTPMVPGGK